MIGYIARIITSFIDIPDEISISIFFSGCSLRCSNDCQNKDLWERSSGQPLKLNDVLEKIETHPLAEYVVFEGGEPTDQMEFLVELCKDIKNKHKALYTGREFEQLPEKLTNKLDLIICGPYVKKLHVGGWPASYNQRILKKQKNKWILKSKTKIQEFNYKKIQKQI